MSAGGIAALIAAGALVVLVLLLAVPLLKLGRTLDEATLAIRKTHEGAGPILVSAQDTVKAVNAQLGEVEGITKGASFVFQNDALLPWKPVEANVALGPLFRGTGKKEALAMARDWLRVVGLAGFEQHYPHQLSGGMRKRASLAAALINKPSILLMDEPFSALDAITRAMVQELAAELLEGRTVLLITHDPMEACRLGHHLMVLSGYPARLGTPITVAGTPPRSPDDPNLQKSQGELLRLFVENAR